MDILDHPRTAGYVMIGSPPCFSAMKFGRMEGVPQNLMKDLKGDLLTLVIKFIIYLPIWMILQVCANQPYEHSCQIAAPLESIKKSLNATKVGLELFSVGLVVWYMWCIQVTDWARAKDQVE